MSQLSLFDQQPERKYIFKVRLTNLMGRSCDDQVRYYNSLLEAEECLQRWRNKSPMNSGIITKQERRSLSGLIS